MRLDKYLSELSLGSRSQVKDYIRSGLVSVDGKTVKDAAFQVSNESEVFFKGEKVVLSEFEYYIVYKPSGCLTARTDAKKTVVMDMVPSKRKDLSPVGRLDGDTEGLLLITNDGALNHKLVGPSNHVKKKYYAELSEELPDNAEDLLKRPIEFKDFTSLPAEAFERITSKSAYLTIREGKYHEVKRMFHAIGTEVVYLKRVEFGPLTLSGLERGEARPLTEEEIKLLKEVAEA